VVVVDKPAGMTSHDVVARVRRLVGSRKVGHAGTHDPKATGVLVLGVERATRMLGHLPLGEKEYDATIRLGVTTVTDDAEGDVVATSDASGVTEPDLRAGVAALTGPLSQVPSAVSAVKVDGVRSYRRVQAGESFELAARPVTVHEFDVLAVRRVPLDFGAVVDVDVHVACTAGTYVRALARDLGAALAVGGHLTALRRTRVGPFGLDRARTLDELTADADVGEVGLPVLQVVRDALGVVEVSASDAARVRHGAAVALSAVTGDPGEAPVGVVGPDANLLSLAVRAGGLLRPLLVLAD
jgi:tRNA pseudouridine55 synthase